MKKCKHLNVRVISSNLEEGHLCILENCLDCNYYKYLISTKKRHEISHWFKLAKPK